MLLKWWSQFAAALSDNAVEIILTVALAAAVGFFGYLGYGLVAPPQEETVFSGERALSYAARQMEYGPRITGSMASEDMTDWLVEDLSMKGWNVYIQPFEAGTDEGAARNIIAVQGEGPSVVLGAHYDTRIYADEDPDPEKHSEPVPGANDGASGVAVLMELASTLDVEATGREVCLVFFDAGANARIEGWDSALGSRTFVGNLQALPRCGEPTFAIIVDMIGDTDQQFHHVASSSAQLVNALWSTATDLDYGDSFINQQGYTLTGDHTAFVQADIPTAAVIDYNYPHQNTTEDTLDKLSAQSLERVGRTLEVWLESDGNGD